MGQYCADYLIFQDKVKVGDFVNLTMACSQLTLINDGDSESLFFQNPYGIVVENKVDYFKLNVGFNNNYSVKIKWSDVQSAIIHTYKLLFKRLLTPKVTIESLDGNTNTYSVGSKIFVKLDSCTNRYGILVEGSSESIVIYNEENNKFYVIKRKFIMSTENSQRSKPERKTIETIGMCRPYMMDDVKEFLQDKVIIESMDGDFTIGILVSVNEDTLEIITSKGESVTIQKGVQSKIYKI